MIKKQGEAAIDKDIKFIKQCKTANIVSQIIMIGLLIFLSVNKDNGLTRYDYWALRICASIGAATIFLSFSKKASAFLAIGILQILVIVIMIFVVPYDGKRLPPTDDFIHNCCQYVALYSGFHSIVAFFKMEKIGREPK